MTVLFDTSTGCWRVVADDGAVVMDGFESNASAWRWIDARSDQWMSAVADRVRQAFSTRPIMPKPKPMRLSLARATGNETGKAESETARQKAGRVMTKKLDWRRARQRRPTEDKYATGTELRSGRVVRELPPRDDLEANARDAEQRWLRHRF